MLAKPDGLSRWQPGINKPAIPPAPWNMLTQASAYPLGSDMDILTIPLPPAMNSHSPSFTTQGVTSRSLLAAATYTVSTTAAVSPPYAALMYPKVQALIQSAYSNSTNSAGLAVKSLRSISKQGVAGNGVCETGEMPSAAENFTGWHCVMALCCIARFV